MSKSETRCGLLRRFASAALVAFFCMSFVCSANAMQVSRSVTRAVLKYFGKEGAEEGAEFLAKQGSKELVERITKAAVSQGGEEAVEKVAKLVGKHGPEALEAFGNAPSLLPVLKALDDIPESQLQSALTRMAAGSGGRELAEAAGRFGAGAIKSELKHPGVGLKFVTSLGDEGAELAGKMTVGQATSIGRYVDDIGKLPEAQRRGILALLRKDTESVASFAGRFAQANPGKILFSVAATTVILAESERILGGDELTFDAEGNPIVVSKPGALGRGIKAGGEAASHVSNQYMQPLFYTVMAFAATFAVLWIALKLYHAHQREKLITQAKVEANRKADPDDEEPLTVRAEETLPEE